MHAMVLTAPGAPLVAQDRADPVPGPGELRLRVRACGVCRTDLHIADGELPPRRPAIVLGHEVVGIVDAIGAGVTGVAIGDRLGVPWLGETCGHCRYCRGAQENLCDTPGFTGWTRDGGYADTMVARADFCFPIPEGFSDVEAAPLLCAGLIGYRSWRKAGEGGDIERLGLYGFGAAAHLLASSRWRRGRRSTPSPDRAMRRRRAWRARWAASGPAARTRRRLSRSTPRSCSRRSARWCRRRCARCARAARWCAAAST
jgi:propanol-preferring alcohol dehydrogenase